MATDFKHSPADVLRWLIVQKGLGSDPDANAAWPVSASGELPEGDAVIATKDTTGIMDGREMIGGSWAEHFGSQIIVRAATHVAGWQKARDIAVTLDKQVLDMRVNVPAKPNDVPPTPAATYIVHCVNRAGPVLPIGKETPKTRRSLFTINVTFPIREET